MDGTTVGLILGFLVGYFVGIFGSMGMSAEKGYPVPVFAGLSVLIPVIPFLVLLILPYHRKRHVKKLI